VTPPGNRRHVVFISHSGTDTWVAQAFAEKIQALGASTFLDEANIAIGDDFDENILGALKASDELLVLLTPWSLKRPYVWVEIGAAAFKRIPVIGVLYGLTAADLDRESGVPLLIRKRNLIDINEFSRYLRELRNGWTRCTARPAMSDNPSVFISHSRRDTAYAEALRDALKARKINVWFDSDIQPGDDWQESLGRALEESSAVSVLLTPESTGSLWMAAELGAALALDKDLIPIVDRDLEPSSIPGPLRLRTGIEKREPDRVAAEIARRVHYQDA
jgi:hypothetical protein